MEELIKQLNDLQEKRLLVKEEILKLTSIEELFYLIKEAMSKEPENYENLYLLFDQVRELSQEQYGLNIFSEDITIKFYFLSYLYNIDMIILNALLNILSPVLLDYELDKRFLKDNDFAQYYFKKYKEFKQDNEYSLLKMLQKLDTKQLRAEGAELEAIVTGIRKSFDI